MLAVEESLNFREWLALEVVEGAVPDIRSTSLVCRLLRKALMSGYRRIGMQDCIPEVVSGHTPDGLPTKNPHLAMAPLACVGSNFADARVFGYALIPPKGIFLNQIDGFADVCRELFCHQTDELRFVLKLSGKTLKEKLALSPVFAPGEEKKDLLSEPYLCSSKLWSSVTPIALDRHLKQNNEEEIRELVARACANSSLPVPESIQVGIHSGLKGAPPASPLAGEPRWAGWKKPDFLKSRSLIHATISFSLPVPGPVLVGAGRFIGLGFCRSLEF